MEESREHDMSSFTPDLHTPTASQRLKSHDMGPTNISRQRLVLPSCRIRSKRALNMLFDASRFPYSDRQPADK